MAPYEAFILGMFVAAVIGCLGAWLDNIQSARLLRRFMNVVFYGPHRCERCGRMIAKAEREQGGKEYDYPEGPIYPNTKWRRHSCPVRFVLGQS